MLVHGRLRRNSLLAVVHDHRGRPRERLEHGYAWIQLVVQFERKLVVSLLLGQLVVLKARVSIEVFLLTLACAYIATRHTRRRTAFGGYVLVPELSSAAPIGFGLALPDEGLCTFYVRGALTIEVAPCGLNV